LKITPEIIVIDKKNICYRTIITTLASRNYVQDAPPPYTPPSGPWYAAPPPAYSANPQGYGGWIPPTNVFTDQPART
jgi:hypothetical protein